LQRLFVEQPESVRLARQGDAIAGFIAARSGRRAVQLGPCIAAPDAGPLLLADALQRHEGRLVYLDVPEPNTAATRVALGGGLTVQRHLTRMVRGLPVVEAVERLWASSGPECG
jgi:hypothetical protein